MEEKKGFSLITRHRKKPLVVKAVKFEDTDECKAALSALGLNPIEIQRVNGAENDPVLHITNRCGEHKATVYVANVGDYVVRGAHGLFFASKPEAFEFQYERIE